MSGRKKRKANKGGLSVPGLIVAIAATAIILLVISGKWNSLAGRISSAAGHLPFTSQSSDASKAAIAGAGRAVYVTSGFFAEGFPCKG